MEGLFIHVDSEIHYSSQGLLDCLIICCLGSIATSLNILNTSCVLHMNIDCKGPVANFSIDSGHIL